MNSKYWLKHQEYWLFGENDVFMVWLELWATDRTETRVKILKTAEDWKKVLRLPDPYEKMMALESAFSPLPEDRWKSMEDLMGSENWRNGKRHHHEGNTPIRSEICKDDDLILPDCGLQPDEPVGQKDLDSPELIGLSIKKPDEWRSCGQLAENNTT